MQLLFLTPQRPFPTHQGTTIRNFHLIDQMAQRHDVSLLTFLEPDQSDDHGPLPEICRRFEVIPAPQRSTGLRLRQLLTSSRPDMSWRLWSDLFAQTLTQWLQQDHFSVIQVEGIEMAPYIPLIRTYAPQAHLIYDDHNAEWLLQARNFDADLKNPRRWLAALYSFIQMRRLQTYERWACQTADAVIAVSEADASAIRQLDPSLEITLVPNGVDVKAYQGFRGRPVYFDLVFTGKMDYRPNIDAMLWFGQHVWPLILAERANTTLAIVGQRPHPRLDILREQSNITITGFVDDVRPYIAGSTVYVAPFRVGGGTRLKLLEAMAMSKAIVATSVGAEGFPIAHGQEMLLTDDPAMMADAILRLLKRPRDRANLGRRAAEFVAANYDWKAIVPRVEKLYARVRSA